MADFAVIVGIGQYPKFAAQGVAENLAGPNQDAQGVYDWLVDPDGGRLLPENVKLLRSADFAPPSPDDPQPAKAKIEQALQWVEEQTEAEPGNRLYLYFSGHGFSPALEEGALFTADATLVNPQNVWAHSWLRWFRTAQRFRETVLWMDSCMNYQQSVLPGEVTLRMKVGTGIPGPTFIALAAQTKSALEYPMSDDRVHGVFTWTLLKGLAGGAADERGRVTGDSLKSFLYTVMPEFLPADVHNSTAFDLQPFVRADEGMVFKRLAARVTYPVRLSFPGLPDGAELRIWTGRPLTNAVTATVNGGTWNGELLRGLYVAEVPSVGLRQGFQVSGAGPVEVTVTRSGQPVVEPVSTDLFALNIVPGNPAASITVLDFRLELAFTETGELHERDLPGVYKVRVEFGRDITTNSDEVVLLDRDTDLGQNTAPPLFSPAPIPGTAATHEFHVEPFEEAASRDLAHGPKAGQAVISVLSRYWTDPGAMPMLALGHPMAGLTLVNSAGRRVGDLARESTVADQPSADSVAVWERQVPPGVYYLRQTHPDGRRYESCVVASPDWVTQIAIQRSTRGSSGDPVEATGSAQAAEPIEDAAVFLRRPGAVHVSQQDSVIEAARTALTQGRNLFAEGRGAELADLLLVKFDDPVAAIIGGHLLLRAADDSRPNPVQAQQFDMAVRKLRTLVGTGHPDVEALSLRCTDPTLRADQPFTAPPMFRHSWQLLTEASYQRPELCPIQLWQRVHATLTLGPYLVWAADRKTRAVHTRQLTSWMAELDADGHNADRHVPNADVPMSDVMSEAFSHPASYLESMPSAPWPGGRAVPEAVQAGTYRLQVPATAAKALWTAGREAAGRT